MTAEAAVMAHVAGHGFGVPEVFAADGAGLVMARVEGPTMLTAQVAVDDSPLSGIANAALPAFLAHAGGRPADHLDHAVAFRRADPNLTGREAARLTEAACLVRARV